MYTTNPIPTKRQRQIIAGAILGGASIITPKSKNSVSSYLSMRCIDLRWLQWKAAELREFTTEKPITYDKTYRWRTLCYPIFYEFKSKFYQDNKRIIDIDHISSLDALGIGIWFADCGSFQRGHVIFNTNIFGEENTKLIAKYFELCGWEISIIKERKKSRIIFSEDSTKNILKIIDPVLPVFKLEQIYKSN